MNIEVDYTTHYLEVDGINTPLYTIDAQNNGLLIGQLYINMVTTDIANLSKWYVEREFRGNKVGRVLMNMGCDWARESGASLIMGTVGEKFNTTMRVEEVKRILRHYNFTFTQDVFSKLV